MFAVGFIFTTRPPTISIATLASIPEPPDAFDFFFSHPLERVVDEDEPSRWQFAEDFPRSGFILTARTLESFWGMFVDWPHFGPRTSLCLRAIHRGHSRWISVYANMTARKTPREKRKVRLDAAQAVAQYFAQNYHVPCEPASRAPDFFNVLIKHDAWGRRSRGVRKGRKTGFTWA